MIQFTAPPFASPRAGSSAAIAGDRELASPGSAPDEPDGTPMEIGFRQALTAAGSLSGDGAVDRPGRKPRLAVDSQAIVLDDSAAALAAASAAAQALTAASAAGAPPPLTSAPIDALTTAPPPLTSAPIDALTTAPAVIATDRGGGTPVMPTDSGSCTPALPPSVGVVADSFAALGAALGAVTRSRDDATAMPPAAAGAGPITASEAPTTVTVASVEAILEYALGDLAHDPPVLGAAFSPAAAMLGTPIVASHRIPADFARGAGHRTAQPATVEPVPALAAQAVVGQAAGPAAELASIGPSPAALSMVRDAPAAAAAAPRSPHAAEIAESGPAAGPVVQITPMPDGAPASAPLTPLEQAVHDLVDRIGHDREDEPGQAPAGESLPDAVAPQGQPAQRSPVTGGARTSEPAPAVRDGQPAEPPANPSHVHLVVDDGPERVVVTVAMRGNDVHVALRGGDDTTTAALARNAGSLDHAMRARGLVLGELTAEREPSHHQHQHQRHDREPPPEPDRRKPGTERFTLDRTGRRGRTGETP